MIANIIYVGRGKIGLGDVEADKPYCIVAKKRNTSYPMQGSMSILFLFLVMYDLLQPYFLHAMQVANSQFCCLFQAQRIMHAFFCHFLLTERSLKLLILRNGHTPKPQSQH